MKNEFPKLLYVAIEGRGEQEYPVAHINAEEAVEDDGPTRVATYQLVRVNKLSKRLVIAPAKNSTGD